MKKNKNGIIIVLVVVVVFVGLIIEGATTDNPSTNTNKEVEESTSAVVEEVASQEPEAEAVYDSIAAETFELLGDEFVNQYEYTDGCTYPVYNINSALADPDGCDDKCFGALAYYVGDYYEYHIFADVNKDDASIAIGYLEDDPEMDKLYYIGKAYIDDIDVDGSIVYLCGATIEECTSQEMPETTATISTASNDTDTVPATTAVVEEPVATAEPMNIMDAVRSDAYGEFVAFDCVYTGTNSEGLPTFWYYNNSIPVNVSVTSADVDDNLIIGDECYITGLLADYDGEVIWIDVDQLSLYN